MGVTSPRDLTLTLPYFGDHELFRDVSTHELAHQFTIQKLREHARHRGTHRQDHPERQVNAEMRRT